MPTWIRTASESVYASDGWRVAYSAIRFRRLDLSSGREVASIRTGTAVRCMAVLDDAGDLLVATDSKLLRLHDLTLQETERWATRIPRYSDHIAVRGRLAVVSNWHRPGVALVDLDTGRVRRRPTPAMTMVVDAPADPMLVGGEDGFLAVLDVAAATIRPVAEVPAAIDAAIEPDGEAVWLTLGVRGIVTASSVTPGSPTRRLVRLSLVAPRGRVTYRLPTGVTNVAVGRDDLWLWSRRDLLVMPRPVSAGEPEARSWRPPPDHDISSVDPDARVAILLRSEPRASMSEIACHRLIG